MEQITDTAQATTAVGLMSRVQCSRDAVEVALAARQMRRRGQVQEFEAAAPFAELSGREHMIDAEGHVLHGERLIRIAGEGTPLVAEFADLELGPALRMSPEGAHLLMRDALAVKFRLPQLWNLCLELKLEVWQCRDLGLLASPARALQLLQASLTDELPDDLDVECPARGQRGHTCGEITVDPDRLLPKADVVVHLSDHTLQQGDSQPGALARSEQLGPQLVEWLADLLGHHRITLRPVLAAGALMPSDAYDIPARMREAVTLRNPTSVFPNSARRSRGCDLDHTQPWQGNGPPGLTRPDNLGALTRKQHRAKTHAGWSVQQIDPGCFLWRGPLGYGYLVTPSATISLTRPPDTYPHLTFDHSAA